MAKSRKREDDVPGNGTHPETQTAVSDPPPAPEAAAEAAPANGEGRKPETMFSYLVNHETYVQASVWKREAKKRDGSTFVTYDISVRKRYYDVGAREWKSAYSFAASEVFAVQHALEQATRWVADARSGDIPF